MLVSGVQEENRLMSQSIERILELVRQPQSVKPHVDAAAKGQDNARKVFDEMKLEIVTLKATVLQVLNHKL